MDCGDSLTCLGSKATTSGFSSGARHASEADAASAEIQPAPAGCSGGERNQATLKVRQGGNIAIDSNHGQSARVSCRSNGIRLQVELQQELHCNAGTMQRCT